ncbi:30S ribosomal protein S6 [Myxococcus sp. CA051A]|uniref:Small ribosomal subunit protein bS6 n=1 Tax=Myxococcus llanfairpwllgwyngyllgogerychwyrndrobwllllantysiliogogogochensis TaxID=2590453 RepID=A0A540WMG2_9BACT|nr:MULTISPECIES: 30S ribosomal protein S6 [Myxococcus]NTX12071.1 30S ribosomal protein S6 [Myxococcus sp. CA056]NTX33086.1 30S ribosomal protein S6 [Myxococcus sp. CA033]NTX56092.1 30S ribosomal protein S6 [Myxococcus sp. CA039A]NTX59850.1 30S ribosomal protein S6 [Myxococcus sp. CA051A]TQF10208.1 30S ribosomal protein S6 [Myxococcus llanfairpwllgwyngyllgogerychwyrndrobwllllantysiliogogogochensis]
MAETQAAKRLREYETIFLVKPDLTDDNVDKLKERVRGIVSREGGKVLRFTVWGKKKTLFPVAKQPRAIYVHASYLGGSGLVAEIERNLKNLDEVTRYISVKLADEVDPETRPVLEDLKLAGDVEETRPGAPEPREGGGFRGDVAEESVGEAEEESSEEA